MPSGSKEPIAKKATRYLEEALGVVADQVKKPEYRQQAKTKQRIGA